MTAHSLNLEPALVPLTGPNQTLQAHVHPPGWVNPSPAPRYDLVVIGAGTAGLVVAAGAAGLDLGLKVALVEKSLMGGDCLNVGCVPSKCIIRSSRVVADMRAAAPFGIQPPESIKVDFAAVMDRMRQIRADISHHAGVPVRRADDIVPVGQRNYAIVQRDPAIAHPVPSARAN